MRHAELFQYMIHAKLMKSKYLIRRSSTIYTQSCFLISYTHLLVVLLQGLSGDTVQVSLTVLRDSSTTLWVDLNNTDLLQSLQDSSVDRTRSVSMLVWSETSVDGTTVQLVQLTDTNLLSQVDVSGSRSSSLVEPSLGFLRWQLVTCGGLNELNVTWNLQLTLTLQELSVSVDELLSWNVSVLLVIVKVRDLRHVTVSTWVLYIKRCF